MRQLAALAILAAALSATSSAAAQDNANETTGAPVPALSRQADYANDCSARDGLSLCVRRTKPSRAKAARGKKEPEGALTGLTRVAGMFMGRVDAADAGAFRFRFQLALR